MSLSFFFRMAQSHGRVLLSVARLGNLLHFGQLFKACGKNYFAQISHIFSQFLLSCQNLSFCQGNNFGQLFAIFYWSHWFCYESQSSQGIVWEVRQPTGDEDSYLPNCQTNLVGLVILLDKCMYVGRYSTGRMYVGT